MNRKFKHKISGNIATETSSEKNYKVEVPQNFTIPKWIVENSYDWEEIIDIPKYVKCIIKDTNIQVNKIYKVISMTEWNVEYGDGCNTVYNLATGPYYTSFFIPSTKEEYEAQFKDYEILSFTTTDNRLIKLRPSGDYSSDGGVEMPLNLELSWLKEGLRKIHSIKRNSDGETFSIGDKIEREKFVVDRDFTTIDKIYYNEHGQLSYGTNSGRAPRTFVFNNETKHYKTPLFITEDNIPIYEGDEYWFINTDEDHPPVIVIKAREEAIRNNYMKRFSTKQAAENYIKKNKVLFVTDDNVGLYLGDTCYHVYRFREDKEWNSNKLSVTNPLGWGRINDNRHHYFSTEKLAQEFVDMHNILYSLKDVEEVFKDANYNGTFAKSFITKLKNLKK